MSGRHVHCDDALPRASLLCYFRDVRRQYNRVASEDVERGSPPPAYERASSEDDERDVKLEMIDSDHYDENADEDDGSWGTEEVITACIYGFLTLLMIMNVDMFLSRWGVGWYGWVGTEPAAQESNMAKVYFCREPATNAIWDPQAWHYISSDAYQSCATELLTFDAASDEILKLSAGDRIVVAGSEIIAAQGETDGKFLSDVTGGGEKDETTPDDDAEEGTLRQVPGNSMHAGFGGPWRPRA